jgi:hypothetical protein
MPMNYFAVDDDGVSCLWEFYGVWKKVVDDLAKSLGVCVYNQVFACVLQSSIDHIQLSQSSMVLKLCFD